MPGFKLFDYRVCLCIVVVLLNLFVVICSEEREEWIDLKYKKKEFLQPLTKTSQSLGQVGSVPLL